MLDTWEAMSKGRQASKCGKNNTHNAYFRNNKILKLIIRVPHDTYTNVSQCVKKLIYCSNYISKLTE